MTGPPSGWTPFAKLRLSTPVPKSGDSSQHHRAEVPVVFTAHEKLMYVAMILILTLHKF